MNRKYETVIVFNPDLDEGKVKDETKKVEGLLKNSGASNVAVDIWGKKQIAYHVGKHHYGTFVCLKYDSQEGGIVDAVGNSLRITDPVIKFQTHRIADRVRKFKGNPKRTVSDQGDDFDLTDSDY